jgi:hypothetical protein
MDRLVFNIGDIISESTLMGAELHVLLNNSLLQPSGGILSVHMAIDNSADGR